MAKPAEMLREMDARDTPAHAEVEMRDAAALLDECERLLRNSVEALLHGSPKARIEAARQASATLAKLRGEQ